jgi:hypothetical protein
VIIFSTEKGTSGNGVHTTTEDGALECIVAQLKPLPVFYPTGLQHSKNCVSYIATVAVNQYRPHQYRNSEKISTRPKAGIGNP